MELIMRAVTHSVPVIIVGGVIAFINGVDVSGSTASRGDAFAAEKQAHVMQDVAQPR